jgi:AsmA protein
MRKIIFGIVFIVILFLGLVLFLPGLIPSDVYKDKIETQLSKELGRDVTISGDVKLQSFPFIRAKTSGVSIKNYEGFTESELLSIETLEARIRLLPLLSKRVEISGFDLIKPIISLERRADGRANWESIEQAEANDSKIDEGPFKRDGRFNTLDPQIEKFTLVDGRISYVDAVAGQNYRLEDIDGTLALPGLAGSLEIDLALDYEDQRSNIDLTLDSPRAFLDGKETPLNVNLETGFGTLRIDGQFLASQDLDFQGQLDSNISDIDALSALSPQDIPYVDLLNSLSAKGDVTYLGGTVSANSLDISLQGEGLVASYTGDGRYDNGEATASGRFETKIDDLADIAQKMKLENDYASLLRTVTAKGMVKVDGETITLTDMTAGAENGAVNGTFSGGLNVAETPTANGDFTLKIADLSEVTKRLPEPVPYSQAIKTLETSGNIVTQNQTFMLSALNASLSQGLLNGTYIGGGQYALNDENALSLEGQLEANITDLRALAALGGTELPPNTQSGAIFQTVALEGALSGTAQALSLGGAKIEFDDIAGTGEATVLLTGTKPELKANLSLDGLDLRPYMASYSAQNPSGEIQPWSEAPINVEAFKAVDGTFNLSTPNVVTDRLSLGQTNINATLQNGVLVADLPNLSLYSGGGRVDLTFDASKSVPELTLTAGLDKLNGNNFLTAIAGFTQASGKAKTDLTISASGRSQAEIMRNLNGQGGFNLASGSIKGIDTAQFLSGLDQALTARQLPGGIGAQYETIYEDIAALFEIKNGVVSINEFDLSAKDVSATGLGEIDLGNQTIDFRFRPRAQGENANKLAAFGIPLKFSGGFGSASAGLDAEFLTEIVTSKAKAEAAKRITDNVGGPVGNILGGIIGGGQTSGSNTQSQDTDASGSETAAPATPPSAEDAVTNALGGLLGLPSKKDDEKKDETDNAKDQEDEKSELEKSLGKLFGE